MENHYAPTNEMTAVDGAGISLPILFGDLDSGNVHKAQMILRRMGIPYRRVDTAQTRGEPRSREFLNINPMGKVPAVLLEDGSVLTESGAILFFFGSSTNLWPSDIKSRTEVLRWMFFEQYSHEPTLAVLRYLKRYTDDPKAAESRIPELEPRARHALNVMEQRLTKREWLACEICTLADYALYPYTSLMEESGINPGNYPAIQFWLRRMEAQPGFIRMGQDGAAESIPFSEHVLKMTGSSK